MRDSRKFTRSEDVFVVRSATFLRELFCDVRICSCNGFSITLSFVLRRRGIAASLSQPSRCRTFTSVHTSFPHKFYQIKDRTAALISALANKIGFRIETIFLLCQRRSSYQTLQTNSIRALKDSLSPLDDCCVRGLNRLCCTRFDAIMTKIRRSIFFVTL